MHSSQARVEDASALNGEQPPNELQTCCNVLDDLLGRVLVVLQPPDDTLQSKEKRGKGGRGSRG